MPLIKEIHGLKKGKIFEVSLFPHYWREGDFLGSVAVIKDIAEKREDEMRLIMNERLAALGEMASGIAHELNNPLATIAACTEGLLSRVEKENIGSVLFRNYLKIIEEEINRCKNITTGMLSFVRKSPNEKKEIDIHEVLDKALDMMSLQGKLKGIEVLKNFQRKVPNVLLNDGELMQVFISHIANALDAMEEKGTLTLETGTAGNDLFIRVCDTGPGISSELLDRIFDPFFTTKSEKGGTGLGLSIAKKIIDEYKGRIDVASKEGKGTVFTITLPA